MDESAFTYCDPADPPWRRLLIDAVERLTGRETIKRLYLERQRAGWGAQGDFFTHALEALGVDLLYDAQALDALPREGPLVVAANHPFGVLDGIAACALIGKARPDYRVIANAVLLRAPEMRERLLAVDVSESAQATRAMAHAGRSARVAVKSKRVPVPVGEARLLYPGIDPLASLADRDKVKLLERLERTCMQ